MISRHLGILFTATCITAHSNATPTHLESTNVNHQENHSALTTTLSYPTPLANKISSNSLATADGLGVSLSGTEASIPAVPPRIDKSTKPDSGFPGMNSPATIEYPQPNSTLTASAVTFKVYARSSVEKWQLTISDSNGYEFKSAEIDRTLNKAVTMGDLPTDGRLLMVRLSFLVNGVWDHIDYQYTTLSHQGNGAPKSSTAGNLNCGNGNYAIVSNGPMTNRVNFAILGDGYTAADIDTTYSEHVRQIVSHMMYRDEINSTYNDVAEPYRTYRKFINVCQINLVSQDPGITIGGVDFTNKNTALNSSASVNERLATVSYNQVTSQLTPKLVNTGFNPDWIGVVLNTNLYMGSGAATHAVWSGGDEMAVELALHEAAHSFHGLADEYDHGSCYLSAEPTEQNITKDPSGHKWQHWHGYAQQPGLGPIGAYEGAAYCRTGVYRPSLTSKMKDLHAPFDAVSREKIILDLYKIVKPIDSWTDNTGQLHNPTNLQVKVVDPMIIDVEWFLNGELVPISTGEQLDIAALNLPNGTHRIRVRAYDETPWVRASDRSSMEQSVEWQITIGQ